MRAAQQISNLIGSRWTRGLTSVAAEAAIIPPCGSILVQPNERQKRPPIRLSETGRADVVAIHVRTPLTDSRRLTADNCGAFCIYNGAFRISRPYAST